MVGAAYLILTHSFLLLGISNWIHLPALLVVCFIVCFLAFFSVLSFANRSWPDLTIVLFPFAAIFSLSNVAPFGILNPIAALIVPIAILYFISIRSRRQLGVSSTYEFSIWSVAVLTCIVAFDTAVYRWGGNLVVVALFTALMIDISILFDFLFHLARSRGVHGYGPPITNETPHPLED